jgi:tetratricopeptide (TPR) repeat protein
VLLLFIGGGVGMSGVNLWASYHLRAARSAMERYHTREAISHLQAALSVWPRDPETLPLTSRAARRMGAFDKAEQLLDVYQELRGANDETLILERILVHAERGDIESTREYCQSLIQQDHPDAALILEALGRGFMRTYRLHDAEICLQEWFNRQPDNAQAYFIQAQMYDLQGRAGDSAVSYRRVLTIDPENDDARLGLCAALLQLGLAEEVLPHLEYLKKRTPEYQYVLCLERNGNLEEHQKANARLRVLEEDLQSLHQITTERMQQTPHDPELHYQLGMIFQRAGAAQEALRWFSSALREDPNHVPTHKALMEYYESNGDYGRSREHRQKAGNRS